METEPAQPAGAQEQAPSTISPAADAAGGLKRAKDSPSDEDESAKKPVGPSLLHCCYDRPRRAASEMKEASPRVRLARAATLVDASLRLAAARPSSTHALTCALRSSLDQAKKQKKGVPPPVIKRKTAIESSDEDEAEDDPASLAAAAAAAPGGAHQVRRSPLPTSLDARSRL